MRYTILNFLLIFFNICAFAQHNPTTRDMNLINWMEFAEFVPDKINTVLLPTGTLEPHGVINNGADNTAPTAMAAAIASEVNALIAPTLNYGMTAHSHLLLDYMKKGKAIQTLIRRRQKNTLKK